MKCPKCKNGRMEVSNTRMDAGAVFRTRTCRCGFRSKTVERIVDDSVEPVRKKNPRSLATAEVVARKRGCWVPEDKMPDWKTLKAAGYSSEEARMSLGLPKYEPTVPPKRRTAPARRVSAAGTTATH